MHVTKPWPTFWICFLLGGPGKWEEAFEQEVRGVGFDSKLS